MAFKIRKPQKVPPYLQHIKKAIDPLIEIVNKGIVVDSDTVIVKRLPDGRIQLFLKK